MTHGDVELLRRAWDAFARGDVEAVAQALDPQVRWYATGDPAGEGSCQDRDQAVAFIRRALAEGLTAELLDVRDAGERLVAVMHTHAPAAWGRGPDPHGELVTVRDARIVEMVIYPTVEAALTAAGLAADHDAVIESTGGRCSATVNQLAPASPEP